MTKRLAFFPSKEETETFFDITTDKENFFEPHYNITLGQHIPILKRKENKPEIYRIRWGDKAGEGSGVHVSDVPEEMKKRGVERCVIPVSGFFVWKDNIEKGHPFFVRMMNGPLMCIAGLVYGKDEYVKIIKTKSNVLVQPMTETMPLLLDRPLSFAWLDETIESKQVLNEAAKRFLLTDLSVMRVSKKVNDPKNNDAKLIQPIPK